MKDIKTVDEFLMNVKHGKEILFLLRDLILSTGLNETLKWGTPVYTIDGKNVVGIGSFKTYTGLWFFQGALLNDEKKILINAQDDKTKAQRQMRFTSVENVDRQLVLEYLEEAIENQKQGKEIKPDRNKPVKIPAELREAFLNDKELKKHFNRFTPGKKREFAEYIAEAKREETRYSRVKKIIPLIINNVGLNDKYRR